MKHISLELFISDAFEEVIKQNRQSIAIRANKPDIKDSNHDLTIKVKI